MFNHIPAPPRPFYPERSPSGAGERVLEVIEELDQLPLGQPTSEHDDGLYRPNGVVQAVVTQAPDLPTATGTPGGGFVASWSQF
jgi:hypothetical protein